eukprot:220260_1
MSVFGKVEFELKFRWYIPKPVHQPQNQNVIILSTDYEEGNKKGVYEYNLIQNTFNKIYAYDQAFKPNGHGQFIDAKNESLYMFGYGILGIFDLNTKILNTNT